MYLLSHSLFRVAFICSILTIPISGCKQQTSTTTNDSTHSHDHDHGHRHGEPLFGGQITEIGHTHKSDGLIFYFAEILPEKDNTIRLYISSEDEKGKSQAAAIETPTVAAYATDGKEASMFSKEMIFKRIQGEGEITAVLLSGTIPTDLLSNKELSLVVPKIVLGGERLSFALSIKRSPTQDTNHDAELNINNQKPDNGEHDEAAAPESDPAVSKEGSRNGQEESP